MARKRPEHTLEFLLDFDGNRWLYQVSGNFIMDTSASSSKIEIQKFAIGWCWALNSQSPTDTEQAYAMLPEHSLDTCLSDTSSRVDRSNAGITVA